MTGHDHDEEFLRRWSRRKIDGKTAEEASPDSIAPEDGVATAPDGADEAEKVDSDVTADLPDIETLDKDSDYTSFLREGVPEGLKRMALRKLWLSDPVLANLDGLNDYDEDFGEILKTGAEYMRRLAAAGEKFTRPGAAGDEEDGIEEEGIEEAAQLVADNGEPDNDSDSDHRWDDAVVDARPPETGDSSVG